jgi:hypothetical protein
MGIYYMRPPGPLQGDGAPQDIWGGPFLGAVGEGGAGLPGLPGWLLRRGGEAREGQNEEAAI